MLAASAPSLTRLSTALGLPTTALGIYGPTLYKSPEHRSDFDFVICGEAYSRRAHMKVAERLADSEPCRIGNVSCHIRFKLPGDDTWYDPRYCRPEPFTRALAAGRHTIIGCEDINQLEVTDDRCGIFTPSVYGLADGTKLLSCRLGHAAYLKPGDTIAAHQIPVHELCGQAYRVVLGYEDLRRNTT